MVPIRMMWQMITGIITPNSLVTDINSVDWQTNQPDCLIKVYKVYVKYQVFMTIQLLRR